MQTYRITKEKYPYLLQQIKSPPPYLEVAGEIPSDEYKFLCVIGSRTHSSYGKEVCMSLIKGLENYPIVIVSGLAIGIDSLAHRAALEANLKTIAVPGSGLSAKVLHPPSRRNLAKEILNGGGTLISPFEPHQPATKWTFPARNRIMAALSHATLIIEARENSGTLITADSVSQFDRDMLAVPGPITSELSYGPHSLIRDGATAITSSRDVLEALGLLDGNDISGNFQLPLLDGLSPDEQIVINQLKFGPQPSSEIIEKCSLSANHFNIIASQLELKGLICEKSGRYRIVSL